MQKRSLITIAGLITMLGIAGYFIFRFYVLATSLLLIQPLTNRVIIVIFWLGEMFILVHAVGYFLSIIAAARRYERPILSYAGNILPPVVVLISVHDEPESVVRRTVVACRYMDYPNYRILLLDSSENLTNSLIMRQICLDYDVDYFEAPHPRHGAKAGAVNEALKRQRAPYVALFDADYRPSRDFLKSLVPQMEANPKLAYIQTPQYYGNLSNSVVSRASELQQSIFYEYICEAKSTRGATFMCGTNLIVRLSALRDVGGFDEKSITEDFATSLRFLRAGWESRYYNYTAAFGDGPLNLREYLRQQYRWARGTLGLFLTQFGDIAWRRGLSRGQRWEFFLSGSYYFVGLAWLVLVILPVVYVFFRIPVYLASPWAYLGAYVSYFIFSFTFFLQTLVGRRYRLGDWLLAESLALLAVPIYARASFDSLVSKRAKFEKTGKDVDIYEIPFDKLWAQFGLIIANAAAVVAGSLALARGGWDMALGINVFWCWFHFFFFVYLLFVLYAKGSQSRGRRVAGA